MPETNVTNVDLDSTLRPVVTLVRNVRVFVAEIQAQ